MNEALLTGWDRLRHGGLLLDAARLRDVAGHAVESLTPYTEEGLRQRVATLLDGSGDGPAFVTFVLESVCGFDHSSGTWQRGTQVPADLSRTAVTGEAIKPRQVWTGPSGALLPVFFDGERRLGIGRGRRTTSHALQWLRAGREQLAIVTNGRQWRLVFAGLDFDAWCEWDVELWLEGGALQ